MIITAHFSTITKAVNEVRKYRVPASYNQVQYRFKRGQHPTFELSGGRALTLRKEPDGRILMTVDVVGRLVPVGGCV